MPASFYPICLARIRDRTMVGTATPERVQVAGRTAWARVHGLATLIIGGNLPAELTADPEALTRAVGAAVFAGGRRIEPA